MEVRPGNTTSIQHNFEEAYFKFKWNCHANSVMRYVLSSTKAGVTRSNFCYNIAWLPRYLRYTTDDCLRYDKKILNIHVQNPTIRHDMPMLKKSSPAKIFLGRPARFIDIFQAEWNAPRPKMQVMQRSADWLLLQACHCVGANSISLGQSIIHGRVCKSDPCWNLLYLCHTVFESVTVHYIHLWYDLGFPYNFLIHV